MSGWAAEPLHWGLHRELQPHPGHIARFGRSRHVGKPSCRDDTSFHAIAVGEDAEPPPTLIPDLLSFTLVWYPRASSECDLERAGERECGGCRDRLGPTAGPDAGYFSAVCRARRWRVDRRMRVAAELSGEGVVERSVCGGRWVAGLDRARTPSTARPVRGEGLAPPEGNVRRTCTVTYRVRPARTSSPIPAPLEPPARAAVVLSPRQVVDLRRFLDRVPEPRGRWPPSASG